MGQQIGNHVRSDDWEGGGPVELHTLPLLSENSVFGTSGGYYVREGGVPMGSGDRCTGHGSDQVQRDRMQNTGLQDVLNGTMHWASQEEAETGRTRLQICTPGAPLCLLGTSD